VKAQQCSLQEEGEEEEGEGEDKVEVQQNEAEAAAGRQLAAFHICRFSMSIAI